MSTDYVFFFTFSPKAFKLISDVSGSHDIEMTRQSYIETDLSNFVAFRNLSETSECIESLTKEIADIRENIVEVQAVHAEQRTNCLRKLKLEKDKHLQVRQDMESVRQQVIKFIL